MTEKVVLDKTNTAVLLMDLQNGTLEALPAPARELLLANAASVLDTARKRGLPVWHIVVQFEDGYPEISPRNKAFSAVKAAGRLKMGTPSTQIAAQVAPVAGEPVVTKYRTGAFSTSILETLVRAKGINHLVLAGFATSGVVLSTVRWAADRDYRLTVVTDACADPDEEVHRVLTEKVFPRQTAVTTAAELASA